MTTTYLQQTLTDNLDLYEQDHYLWIQTTANLLRERRLNELDFEHLIEEIEDMGKDKRRELKIRLIILLMHLLKYKYQPQRRSSSWRRTIIEQHLQIDSLLEDSPSLNPYYQEIFSDCYAKAIYGASDETKLPIHTFPSESPFLSENLLNRDFISSLINQEED